MKHVRQKHTTSCGVAAFAMVMNLSYRKAMKILFPKRFWWFSDATTKISMLRTGCKKLGYDTELVAGELDFTKIRTRTVLIVQPLVAQEDPEIKHAVVWDPLTKSVLDPASDARATSGYSVEYCLANLCAAIIIM